MHHCRTGHTFENWDSTLSCTPQQFCQPETVADICALVQQAEAAGSVVRTCGAGHSWSDFVLTNQTLLNLDKLTKILRVEGNRVTVQTGIRLKDLTPLLAKQHLGMANVGSILEQSLAGAISTGTHGTGLVFGNLSTQMIGLTLVTGGGITKTITEADVDLLRAARVSIGCLGIITEVTLQCVPFYDLDFTLYSWTFEDVLVNLDVLNHENAHVRLYWLVPPKSLLFPPTGPKDTMLVMTMNPPGTPPGILGSAQDLVDSIPGILENGLLEIEAGLGLLGSLPEATAQPVKLAQCRAPYDRALTLPLLPPHHQECEYAVPLANTVAALQAVQTMLTTTEYSLTLPIEIRTVAADNSMLSLSNKGPVSYIGANTADMDDPFFTAYQNVLKAQGGRPHWGKRFTMTRAEVQGWYPDYNTFTALRHTFDPNNVFANDLIRELFV